LTSILAAAAVIFSLARWHRVGVHFHPLFQFLLMGINGAFLTGDLFNLFVFFEVLLAASYGLAMHGSGSARVMAGLHYIAVNLAASLLFLIGVSLIYGVSGTLNMADLAVRIPTVRADDRALLEAGAGILGIAFLVKAGMWPLCFWLPGTYAAAPSPVASMFAILTKVGVYIVLRLWLLLFGDNAGGSTQFGGEWLLLGGMATIAFGAIGSLASQDMARLAAFSVIVSSGTVLAAIAIGQVGVTGGAIFYLISSTLGLAAFFLLIELVERGREPGADMLAVTREIYGEEDEMGNSAEVGIAIPATMGILGSAFIGCGLIISGLPPLSGFIAKLALLAAAMNAQPGAVSAVAWIFLILLILSGLAALIAITRAGIHAFWASPERAVPRVRLIEMTPVAVLLFLCAIQTIQAGPIIRYTQATAQSLHGRGDYIRGVLGPAAERSSPRGGT
jgi:multicomponent K+:H+ antiporter subunit D